MAAIRVLPLALLLLTAAPAHAQQIALQFKDGQVSISAQNAPIRAILAAWERLGGVTVMHAENVGSRLVTIQLAGVSEREALDTVLRGAAGYLIVPRRPGSQAPSEFERVLILPQALLPPGAASTTRAGATAAAPAPTPGVRTPVPLPDFLARRPELGVEGPRPRQPGEGEPSAATLFQPPSTGRRTPPRSPVGAEQAPAKSESPTP